MIYPELQNLIITLESEFRLIPEHRKAELHALSGLIRESLVQFNRADIIVICTHNSRRSQLGQIWLKAAAMHYGVQNIHTYSGGTEATAFNYRMVLALKRAGFRINQIDSGENPKYYLPLSDNDYSLDILYSKRFDESYNPQKNFTALLVCSQANEACPVVMNAFGRFSLPYADPKQADDSPEESAAYIQKVYEMGREMLYVMQELRA